MIDLDEAYSGAVIEELGRRGGHMHEMRPAGEGRMRLEYLCPARGLIGYRSQFLTDTRGTGVLYHNFKEYGPFAGNLRSRPNGVLISQDDGETNTYGLFYLQERGQLFLGPQIKVYGGQIIGLHSRDNDLVVNPTKAKKLTNIRTTAADEKLFLTPPRVFTLESALEFINDDELVEVTPAAIRLRKRSSITTSASASRRCATPAATASRRCPKLANARRAPACAARASSSRSPAAVRDRASGSAPPPSCCSG